MFDEVDTVSTSGLAVIVLNYLTNAPASVEVDTDWVGEKRRLQPFICQSIAIADRVGQL